MFETLHDFIDTALPWAALAMTAAVAVITANRAKNKEKENEK